MKRLSLALAALLALVTPAFAANVYQIESARSHTAAGALGCSVSGATNATPIVITCAAAHGLQDGDQIQITGVGGNTNANTLGFAKVTSFSTTTFGLYSDVNLTTGVAGNAAYTSGGVVSEAYDISAISADWTIRFGVDSLTSAKGVLIAVQESADGFVSDIRTLGVMSVKGTVPGTGISKTIRSYELPLNRFNVTSARLRLYVQGIDSAATVKTTLAVEY